MSLRYRLSKERFKGKTLPPKIVTNEDHISLDQRGDDSSTDKKSPLSLDKITSTISKPFEDNDISRRGLLGTLNKLKQYAEESDAKDQQILKRKKILLKDPEEEEEETAVAEEESGEAEATEPEAETAPKKGFFKRLLHRFYPPLEEPQSQPPKPEPVATDEGSSPAEEAVESLPLEEETDERVAEDIEMNRRNLIRQGVHLFAKPTIDSIQGKIDRVNETMDKITRRVPLLRPPGAISEQAFLQACTRCDKCIIACPKDAILKVPLTAVTPSINVVLARIIGFDRFAFTTHALPGPGIIVSPNSGMSGSVVTINGADFPTSATISSIRVGNKKVSGSQTQSTDRNGEFVLSFVMPLLSPGVHTITASADGISAVIAFTVTEGTVLDQPLPAPQPSSAPTQALETLPENDNLIRIWTFDNASKSWTFFDPRPAFSWANTITTMEPGRVYWLKLNRVQTAPLNGKSRVLFSGWNLLPW